MLAWQRVSSWQRHLPVHVQVIDHGDLPVTPSIFLFNYYQEHFLLSSFMVRITPSPSESSTLKKRKTEDNDTDLVQVKKSRTRVRSVIFALPHLQRYRTFLFVVSPAVNVIVGSRRFAHIHFNRFTFLNFLPISATDKYRAPM